MITLNEQLAEAIREIAIRRTVYPKLIERGKLKPDEAQRRLAAMQAIAETIKRAIGAAT